VTVSKTAAPVDATPFLPAIEAAVLAFLRDAPAPALIGREVAA